MSAHILLNVLNKLGKEIKCEACPRLASILSLFCNKFNKKNNT